MFRRQFIQGITVAGSSLGIGAAEGGQRNTVVYHVRGFSCITCAVGLETMLKRENGILQAKATYPEGVTRIEYDAGLIAEKSIRALISDMGFSVADERRR